MVAWEVVFSKQAAKDAKKITQAGLRANVEKLLAILCEDPFENPPSYEKLVGDLQGAYSRRINLQHRLVYDVFSEEKMVRILKMWTHYE
jgi:toxin YoeB